MYQYEYCEQQFPQEDPRHVIPPVAPNALPHRALVEILSVEDAAPADEDCVELENVGTVLV